MAALPVLPPGTACAGLAEGSELQEKVGGNGEKLALLGEGGEAEQLEGFRAGAHKCSVHSGSIALEEEGTRGSWI